MKANPQTRLFQWGDLESLANIISRRSRGTIISLSSRPHILREELQEPRLHPTKNILIAEYNDRLNGFAIVTPEINIGRSIISVCTTKSAPPNTTEILIDDAISRAIEQGAEVAHAIVTDDSLEFRAFLERKGFKYIRHLLNMKLSDSNINMAKVKDARFKIRRMRKSEEIQDLTILQNLSFRSHFGYSPNTTEEIEYRLSLPGRFQEIIFAEMEGGLIVAFCWISTTETEGIIKGRLDMLGVHPESRRKGLGKVTLEAGIEALQQQAAESIHLDVDAENVSAVHLYEQRGFYKVSTNVWLERKLP